jgi:5-methylcytosine-specific restriction endonuclease McrA
MPKGVYIRTEEHNRINSESKMGRQVSEESKQRMSIAQKNRKMLYPSEETRKKISEAHKGKPSGMLGKHLSIESRQKISEAKKKNPIKYWLGKKRDDRFRQKRKEYRTGRKHSEETKAKISQAHKGKVFSKEHRINMGKVRIGKKFSIEHRKKIGERLKGEKNWNWKGGISFEPYSIDWTNTLKKSIRERDKYRCQLCGESQGDIAFHVHHIDYNKKNCSPNNLITLCGKCHSKTMHNREYWTKLFIGDGVLFL